MRRCSPKDQKTKAGVLEGMRSKPNRHEGSRDFRWRERGPWACTGGGGPTRHVCSICGVVRTRDRVAGAALLAALAQISTPSAAHFLKSHQLLVQKFAADRNRQR